MTPPLRTILVRRGAIKYFFLEKQEKLQNYSCHPLSEALLDVRMKIPNVKVPEKIQSIWFKPNFTNYKLNAEISRQ